MFIYYRYYLRISNREIARSMGLKTRATFEEALEDAKRKFVGPNPKILALPLAFKVGAVHLCMKDDDLSNV